MKHSWQWFLNDLPYGITNLIRFFPVVWRFRAWDAIFVLDLMRTGLQRVLPCLEHGMECDDTRLPKVDAIQRALLLLTRIIQGHYLALAGEIHGPMTYVSWDLNTGQRVDVRTDEAKAHDRLVIQQAHQLERNDWKELWQIVHGADDLPGSDLRGWWD